MRNLILASALALLFANTSFAEDHKVNVGMSFEEDIFPESTLSLGTPLDGKSDLALRYGVQGYKVNDAGSVKRKSVHDYGLAYTANPSIGETPFGYRISFGLGTMTYRDAMTTRSTHNYYEMAQGISTTQGAISFFADIGVRFHFIGSKEIVTIGPKQVNDTSVFPRFGLNAKL